MATSVARRLEQGLQAMFAFAQPLDMTPALPYLNVSNGELLRLFERMQRSERLHSLRVLRDVKAEGEADRDLGLAALLHDVGKSCYPLAVWQKTLAVLVRTFLPRLFERWSRGSPQNPLERPCVVYVRHPDWSAELVEKAGASEAALWLIAHHQDEAAQWAGHALHASLVRLQRADEMN
ncbi:MAG: HD domain-containing protein [Chloroflexi bacterium]|nr:HD domain-containing protein [Chloroflexota bacterium]